MKILHAPAELAAAGRKVCVGIGMFDGVHLGHQAILRELGAAADRYGAPSCVVTFEPHPREFFSPSAAPTRLTSLREKCELLQQHGVARAQIIRFKVRIVREDICFRGFSAQ